MTECNDLLDHIRSTAEDLMADMETLKDSEHSTSKQKHSLGNAMQNLIGLQFHLKEETFGRYHGQ